MWVSATYRNRSAPATRPPLAQAVQDRRTRRRRRQGWSVFGSWSLPLIAAEDCFVRCANQNSAPHFIRRIHRWEGSRKSGLWYITPQNVLPVTVHGVVFDIFVGGRQT